VESERGIEQGSSYEPVLFWTPSKTAALFLNRSLRRSESVSSVASAGRRLARSISAAARRTEAAADRTADRTGAGPTTRRTVERGRVDAVSVPISPTDSPVSSAAPGRRIYPPTAEPASAWLHERVLGRVNTAGETPRERAQRRAELASDWRQRDPDTEGD
jgi:hypothetical protein